MIKSNKDVYRDAVAVVGIGAVMPDAADAPTFWSNIKAGRYSIGEVPADRWDTELYYDPDHAAPDKTYSKIGGFVRDFPWAPFDWKLPIPPRVGEAMDRSQKWAIAASREALEDFGFPGRALDRERTAVILGNAMSGDLHYLTSARILLPEFAEELARSPSFAALPEEAGQALLEELRDGVADRFPAITEDTMPGELSNIVAGRVAAMFDLHGPNYVTDAACASSMAAITAAVDGLRQGAFDAVLTGGVDANMGPTSYIKFSKIGALSATGSRPYDDKADGFIMGEGAAMFLLRRLEDAERDGDRIYAVIRGFGGSSDGRGKGIVAPNPAGQVRAIRRAWDVAGCSPRTASMIEGHGTSTAVGDAVELTCINEVFGGEDRTPGSIALGSVKSNIGHLKGAAGAAGILKAALALHERVLPPSLGFSRANSRADLSGSPAVVNRELRAWDEPHCGVRRAGVSSFGFGGTNFHAVLEEYIPGRLANEARPVNATGEESMTMSAHSAAAAPEAAGSTQAAASEHKPPLRGALVLGGANDEELRSRLNKVLEMAKRGEAPRPTAPSRRDLSAPVRVAIDYGNAAELAARGSKALRALESGNPAAWRMLRSQGIFRGQGPSPKVAFLFTGQGSQYVNMLADLRHAEPLVAEVFEQADRVMAPLLDHPLSRYIFVDSGDKEREARAEQDLRQTAITQPALLTVEAALVRLFGAYGITPDLVMGHSLGEYGALQAAGALSFPAAMEAVSARGQEMTNIFTPDNGEMVAVQGSLEQIESIVNRARGYVVIANINSNAQAVVGGATEAVREVSASLSEAGMRVTPLPVSHAFHTSIVAPASEPLRRTLERLQVKTPEIPVVANVTGTLYPSGPGAREEMVNILARQVASPVQFVKGLHTLYEEGVRVFVEIGPKKALFGFVDNVLGHHPDLVALFTNHPKVGDLPSFNQCLCGLYAAGLGNRLLKFTRTEPDESSGRRWQGARKAHTGGTQLMSNTASGVQGPAGDVEGDFQQPAKAAEDMMEQQERFVQPPVNEENRQAPVIQTTAAPIVSTPPPAAPVQGERGRHEQLGRLFSDFMGHAAQIFSGTGEQQAPEPVTVTGVSLGLPGGERVFDDSNLSRLLQGEQLIGPVPMADRQAMAAKGITRLRKSAGGAPSFETIGDPAEVIKLAGRGGALDLTREFGVPEEHVAALDATTRLAIGAGLEALRDAGIPLVMRYRTASTGTRLPDRWGLPNELRDDTGVIFGSAFPGYASLMDEMTRFHQAQGLDQRLADLEQLRGMAGDDAPSGPMLQELDRRIQELRQSAADQAYTFDRRFLFKVLAMGHSQFAQLIGARGPNTQINAACASGTQALSLAQDWINAGRCRRVICVTADDVTNDKMMEWIGSGFLASGAAATDERAEDAALPFDRRRHGLVLGMGASGLVVESQESARERGLSPICEVLGTISANSAFHGTRLNPEHIAAQAEELISGVEKRHGLRREEMAPHTVFISHETYTPARGGSAQTEVQTLRRMFGEQAGKVVITNTKGLTGHAMGAGIEDALAVRALETGLVPPVVNFKEPDPELGELNLSRGGAYPAQYALRLAAGFGSQLSMALLRHVPTANGQRPPVHALGHGYRIHDPAAWQAWTRKISGQNSPELEVVHRTLRFKTDALTGQAVAPAAHRQLPIEVMQAATIPLEPTVLPEAPTAPEVSHAPTADPRQLVVDRVLELVAEQTGYPIEMLELDLDMEADLGVDTVKQAETFAAVRQAYDIPLDDEVKLRDMPTLGHVVQWVLDTLPAHEDVPADQTAAPSIAPSTPTADPRQLVVDSVLELVAEQTGYPIEMLELDLDMEADLGVDTVKQAETFAAVREAYDIPLDDEVKLRDMPTLGHVVQWVLDTLPAGEDVPADQTADPASAPSTPVDTSAPPAPVEALGSSNEVQRRIPWPLIRPPMELCKPTGVELDEKSRVLVMPDRYGVGRSLTAKLTARGVEVLKMNSASTPAELTRQVEGWLEQGPIHGVFWLPALDAEEPLAAMDLTAWRLALTLRVKLLFHTMKTLSSHGQQVAGPAPFLVAGTRLGGTHGYGDAPPMFRQGRQQNVGPMGGAVTGFLKSYKREHPDALVKTVDLGPSRKKAVLADLLLQEALGDPGIVEVGYRDGERWTVGLVSRETLPSSANQPLGQEVEGLTLSGDTVYLVTGAAGSIVSAIVSDLCRGGMGGTFHLLDLAPCPDPDDPDLARFTSDLEGLKSEIFQRLKQQGERATPAMVERHIAALERAHAALAVMDTIRQTGGRAVYHQADLRDPEAVTAAVDQVRREHGKLDVLLHAAGLEISHPLPQKSQQEFDLVFDVKSDGWFNLMHAVGDMPLGATVAFSSIAGRFGNAGQTDYAAANDLLCKAATQLNRSRPGTRAICLDWTAWAGIGMATRGSIPKVMERAGIEMLDPHQGIPLIRDELCAGASGEIVVAGELGLLLSEFDSTGGLDASAVEDGAGGPMASRVIAMELYDGLMVETTLDPSEQPFLHDHQIDGTPVLPGVMGIEGFAEAARLLLPGWNMAGLEDVDFLAPFKFYRGEPRTVKLQARFLQDGEDLLARCQLTGERKLPNNPEPQVTTHFTASVRLSRQRAEEETTVSVPRRNGSGVDRDAIYDIYFHGPAYQVVEHAWRQDDVVAGMLPQDLPGDHAPIEVQTQTDPRLIELCFQTAGVWEAGTTGRMGLPRHIDHLSVVRRLDDPELAGRLTAVVTPEPRADGNSTFDAYVADEDGKVYLTLRGYSTVQHPNPLAEDARRPLKEAMDIEPMAGVIIGQGQEATRAREQ